MLQRVEGRSRVDQDLKWAAVPVLLLLLQVSRWTVTRSWQK